MDALVAAPREQILERTSSWSLLGRLWREHVVRYRGRLMMVLVATVVMAGTTALYPVLINHAFQMFVRRDQRILYQLPLLVLVVTSVKAASQYAQSVETQRIVLRVIRDLQIRMFGHAVVADLAQIEREAPAQLAARFTTDATVIRESLTRTTNGLADALTLVGLVASMFYLDWLLSLISAALYPLAGLPIERIGRRIRRASGGMQATLGETAALLSESFGLARTVRTYRLEAHEAGRARRAFEDLYRALMRMARSRARVDPIMEVLGGVAIAAVIGFEGWRAATGVAMGGDAVGRFTGFVAALLTAARPLRALGSLNAAVQEGLAGLIRVFTVIDERPRVIERTNARPLPRGDGHVVFDDVAFFYPDGRPGLSGLGFDAAPGTTVALVGPSGAGKSTALTLIPRLHDVTAGSIRIDGTDVRDTRLDTLRDAIAYVGQDTLLFDATVADNIGFGRSGSGMAEIEAAAAAAQAAEFVTALPAGYATRVGPGGQRLSGGQRQRVALARALLRNPRILLLDEATSALDTESEAAVQTALARLRRGRTTIVVAHRLSTVRDADLVVVVVDGRRAEQGSHARLMEQDGVYARLVRTQLLVH